MRQQPGYRTMKPYPATSYECGCYHKTKNNCDCIDQMPLAMAYVPWQQWEETFEPCNALLHGTLFPELALPFLGKRGAKCC
ncbi:MAG: spore coat associated protein CotJA [Agathobacter sp.]